MLNQPTYGRMNPNPPVTGGEAIFICSKCQKGHSVEALHFPVKIFGEFFARMKDGTLTPSTPVNQEMYCLCSECFANFKGWLGR